VLKNNSVKGTQKTGDDQFSANKATDRVKLGLLGATGHPTRGCST